MKRLRFTFISFSSRRIEIAKLFNKMRFKDILNTFSDFSKGVLLANFIAVRTGYVRAQAAQAYNLYFGVALTGVQLKNVSGHCLV